MNKLIKGLFLSILGMFVFLPHAYCDMDVEITIPTAHVQNVKDMLSALGYTETVGGFKNWVRQKYFDDLNLTIRADKRIEAQTEVDEKAINAAIQ